jgi:hypothetical protein
MDVAQNVSTTGALVVQSLNFQKIVLIIAIVILIVSLVFIGMQIKKSNSKQVWPPFVPQCPDFWKMNSSGKCVRPTPDNAPGINDTEECYPGDNLGIDFTTGDYAGAGGACKKKQWANTCQAAWEGITYGIADPCNNSSIQ